MPASAEQKCVIKMLTNEQEDANLNSDSENLAATQFSDPVDAIDAKKCAIEEICETLHNDGGFCFLVNFEGNENPT